MRAVLVGCGLMLAAVLLTGCGKGNSGAQATADGLAAEEAAAKTNNVPPTASIGTPPEQPAEPLGGMEFIDEGEEIDDDPEHLVELKEGTPEWTLREIAKLQLQPFPQTEDVEELRAARKERNTKIIDMATGVIKQTHKAPEQERLFNVAVHQMLEARMQLALQGDAESVDILYDDAASLWERDRTSKAATDAAFTLVNLAYASARTTAGKDEGKDSRWLEEFARQAKHFVINFPKEERRGAPMLFAAARSCELHGLNDLAFDSYAALQQHAPSSPHAQRVAGIMRRLKLVGQPVPLTGPTLAGEEFSISQLAGKVVIVNFWSVAAKPSQEDQLVLLQMHQKYGKHGLSIVGVCLDDDPAAVKQFVEEHALPWPQLFFTGEGRTGWNNPVATYYGVLEVGNWVIDQQGKAVSTNFQTSQTQQVLFPLLRKSAATANAGG